MYVEICLLCTKKSNNSINIYENPKGDLKYIDILNEVIKDVVLPENIPVMICKKCSVELKEFYLYKKKCIGSIEQWKTLTEEAETIKNSSRKRINEATSESNAKKEKLIEFGGIKNEPQASMKTETSNLFGKINISALKRKLELNINKNLIVEPSASELSNNLNVKIESTDDSEEEFVEEAEPNVQKNTLSLLSNLNVSVLKKKLGSALHSPNKNKRKYSGGTAHLDFNLPNSPARKKLKSKYATYDSHVDNENFENSEVRNEQIEEADEHCEELDEHCEETDRECEEVGDQYEEVDEDSEEADEKNEVGEETEEMNEQNGTGPEDSTHESTIVFVDDDPESDTSVVFIYN